MDSHKQDKLADGDHSCGAEPSLGGKVLASFNRSETEQLRVEWMLYKNHPFVSIRLHVRDHSGKWWPTRKGTSVRIREISETMSALQRAAAMAEENQQSWRNERPAPTPRRHRDVVPPWIDDLPKQDAAMNGEVFNEFDQSGDNST